MPVTENMIERAVALVKSAVDAEGYAAVAARLFVSEQSIRRYYAFNPKKPLDGGSPPASTTARRIIEVLTKK